MINSTKNSRNAMCKTLLISVLSILSVTLPALAFAQTRTSLTLDSCYTLAERNYPLIRQYALIDRSKDWSLDNAARGVLPQYFVGGQATYQSEVTQLPISLPNVDVPALSKDQYKLYGEVTQSLTDLYTVKHQKALIQANAAVEEQKVGVELYKLKDRINQLFFGMLLIDAQLRQTDLLKKDIQAGLDKTGAAIANGIALKSSADLLRAEMLKADQRSIELKAARKGFADMLSLFIRQPVDETTVLEQPATVLPAAEVNRPELRLFAVQRNVFDVQNQLIATRNLPRVSLFLQGGLGRPALNFLENDFNLYYIGGIRFNWNLSGYKTTRIEQKILSINQSAVDLQQETFLFNTQVTLRQQSAEMIKLRELIDTDKDIIALREGIIETTKNQLENGTATSNDYIVHVNAADQAKQNLALHNIQLLLAQYNHKTTSGN